MRPCPAPRAMPPVLRPILRVLAALATLTALAAFTPARAADAAREPLDPAMDAVLVVRSATHDDRFLGSAFIWGAGEVAVTNAHVVGDAADVRLIGRNGAVQVAPVIARDALRDVAVIGLAPGGARGLMPGPVPGLGAPVWALGAPLGLDFTATQGMVSASARQVEAMVPLRLLQHDAAVNPGSSGGPLVDAQGRVVGMNSRIADGSRHFVGVAYAIAAPDLMRIVTGLIDETLAPLPTLGLHLRPLTPGMAAALGLAAAGALVDRVAPGGAAAQAGLLAGDVIATAGPTALQGPGDLAFAIEAAQATGGIALRVLRGGAELRIELPLVPEPAGPLRLRDLSGAEVARVACYDFRSLGMTFTYQDDRLTITALTENSPATLAGLAPGDRILTVNGAPLTVIGASTWQMRAPALILVERAGGATRHVMLDPWDRTAGFRPQGGANVLDPSVVVF